MKHRVCAALVLAVTLPVASCRAEEVSRRAAPADTSHAIRFQGRVVRGERFERALPGGLRFVLWPESSQALGWNLSIYPPATDSVDYAGVATPPYRGINPRYLEGWHFRNQANTGPNRGDVNAPQETRDFRFVATPKDYRAMASALEVVLWPGARSAAELDSALQRVDAVPTRSGTLQVTRLWLGNLVEGEQAWIDSMRFEVEIEAPAGRQP